MLTFQRLYLRGVVRKGGEVIAKQEGLALPAHQLPICLAPACLATSFIPALLQNQPLGYYLHDAGSLLESLTPLGP